MTLLKLVSMLGTAHFCTAALKVLVAVSALKGCGVVYPARLRQHCVHDVHLLPQKQLCSARDTQTQACLLAAESQPMHLDLCLS